eukprot:311201_1
MDEKENLIQLEQTINTITTQHGENDDNEKEKQEPKLYQIMKDDDKSDESDTTYSISQCSSSTNNRIPNNIEIKEETNLTPNGVAKKPEEANNKPKYEEKDELELKNQQKPEFTEIDNEC